MTTEDKTEVPEEGTRGISIQEIELGIGQELARIRRAAQKVEQAAGADPALLVKAADLSTCYINTALVVLRAIDDLGDDDDDDENEECDLLCDDCPAREDCGGAGEGGPPRD
jgi:hypothetical protein